MEERGEKRTGKGRFKLFLKKERRGEGISEEKKKEEKEGRGKKKPGGKLTKVQKQQMLLAAAGVFLGFCSLYLSKQDTALKEGYLLERNSPGQEAEEYELFVKGVTEEELPIMLTVNPKEHTEEEAYFLYDSILKELPKRILGDNASLEEVSSDLTLINQIPEYGVRLRWQSPEPEILDSFGQVHAEQIPEEGVSVRLLVRMTDGRWQKEYELPVGVCQPVLSPEEQKQAEFTKLLKGKEEADREESTWRLPDTLEGNPLSYRMKQESSFVSLTALGVLGAVLIPLKEKEEKKQQEQKRRQQMLLDFSEVLSRLIIFLGAGMSIRTAWDKLAVDYKKEREQGRIPVRYIYEEMYITSCQLKSGVSEQRAFSEFGRRCDLWQYRKFAALLEQNLKNGSHHLREALRLEMAEAFEQRKHQAKRIGEEAGTKLLLPLFMMLSVVMVMIAVPALMAFR